jgi:hypothetical protein
MTESLAAGAPLVLDLLNYIEQVEKLKTKPAFTVPSEFFVAYQHELKGLPELQFNLQVEGDDVWLRLPRLQEIVPPELDEQLKPWVTLPKSPEKSPELKSETVTYEGKREVARAQLKDHPEVQEAFDWYVEYQWEPWAAAERPRRKTIARYNQLFSLQQAISSEGAETPLELVWGIGYAAWKKEGFGTALKYPLLVQACEISLNEKTFELEVRPRDVEPRLEADCYAEMELPGVKQLEALLAQRIGHGSQPRQSVRGVDLRRHSEGSRRPPRPVGCLRSPHGRRHAAGPERQAHDYEHVGAVRSEALRRHLSRRHPAPEEEGRGGQVAAECHSQLRRARRLHGEGPAGAAVPRAVDERCRFASDGAVLPDGLQRRAGLHRSEAACQ